MPRFKVVKVLKFEYETEAENAEAALDAVDIAGRATAMSSDPDDSPVTATAIRERARNLDKQATPVSAIADRKMRAGRVFTRTYHGVLYTATVIPGGRVKLEGGPAGDVAGVFANLNRATQAVLQGKSANCWVFWHNAPTPAVQEEEKVDEG